MRESTMITCPKCGCQQEERLDCIRCGIVFTKYYAMHSHYGSQPADSMDPGPVPYGPAIDEPASTEIAALRMQLRDVLKRCNDLEFERAERNLIRSEIRSLEEKTDGSLGVIRRTLECLEERLESWMASPPPTFEDLERLGREMTLVAVEPLASTVASLEQQVRALASQISSKEQPEVGEVVEDRLDPVKARVASLEQRLEAVALPEVPEEVTRLPEVVTRLEVGIGELEARVSELSELRAPEEGGMARIAEAEKTRSDLDEIRTAIRNVVLRIPDIDAARAALEPLTSSVASLEQQVHALASRPLSEEQDPSEVAEMVDERLEPVKARLTALEQRLEAFAVPTIPEELTGLPGTVTRLEAGLAEAEKMRHDLNELRTAIRDVMVRIPDIDAARAAQEELQAALTSLRDELEWVKEMLAEQQTASPIWLSEAQKESPPAQGEPAAATLPLEAEMHAIRENLDDIRRMVSALATKI